MDALIREAFGPDAWTLAVTFIAFIASAVVRGFTGGIGSNFLTSPVLSVLIGPRGATPIIIALSMVGNAQLTPRILPHVRWRAGWPIFLLPVLTAPLGVWVLFAVGEDSMRRAVAGLAAGFLLLLQSGWR